MVSYIIVTRNPKTKRLLILADEVVDGPAEFATEEDAFEVCENNPVCRAWGSDVVRIDF